MNTTTCTLAATGVDASGPLIAALLLLLVGGLLAVVSRRKRLGAGGAAVIALALVMVMVPQPGPASAAGARCTPSAVQSPVASSTPTPTPTTTVVPEPTPVATPTPTPTACTQPDRITELGLTSSVGSVTLDDATWSKVQAQNGVITASQTGHYVAGRRFFSQSGSVYSFLGAIAFDEDLSITTTVAGPTITTDALAVRDTVRDTAVNAALQQWPTASYVVPTGGALTTRMTITVELVDGCGEAYEVTSEVIDQDPESIGLEPPTGGPSTPVD